MSYNENTDIFCHCGAELIQMGSLYKCPKCHEVSYMDDEGDLMSATESEEYEDEKYD